MILPVPVFMPDGKIFNQVEYHKPKNDAIVTAYEVMQRGNVFLSMVTLLAGSIDNFTSIDGEIVDNPQGVKNILGNMFYPAAETVALKVMCLLNKDDTVEGVYPCPRCGTKIITERNQDTGEDTRDKISDLEIDCMSLEEYLNEIVVTPENPVVIRNLQTQEIIQTIENFSIRFPTMNACIAAGQNMAEGREVRIQINIYIASIIKVNGAIVDKIWISKFGLLLFNKLYSSDISQISDVISKYGIKKTVQRTCYSCGKVWEAPINTSNFFASGLQSV